MVFDLNFDLNIYAGALTLTALLSLVVAVIAGQRLHPLMIRQSFVWMMIAIAGYAAVAALEATSVTLQAKILWSTLEYVGSGSVITLFLIFVLYFIEQRPIPRRKLLLLWVIPLFNMGLVATNGWHGLIWSAFLPGPSGSSLIIYQHGTGFYWVMACVYLYTLTGVLLLLKTIRGASVLHRQQALIALVGAFVPLVGGSAYMFDLTPPGLNVTPMSFMITGIVYFVGLFRFQLFELIPIARDVLIEKMRDGVLVLDRWDRIIDMNPAARAFLDTPQLSISIGQPIHHILPDWGRLVKPLWICDDLEIQMQLESPSIRYVELRITSFRDRFKRLSGRLLILRDITQRQETNLALRRVNQQLHHQLQEIKALQDQLREQAIRDSLTGLYNRRYLEETLPRELIRASRDKYPVAVILMDIDFFKRINDTYGHLAGDCVLQRFADLLRQHSRSSDIACRYGGEEFLLVLPSLSLALAHQRAEQIRLSFQGSVIQSNHDQIWATVSAGVGVFPEDAVTAEQLLYVVDQALYRAKFQGRNQVLRVQDREKIMESE